LELLGEARLKRDERAEQLDHLDQDPVVGGGGEDLEELRCETKVVLGVSSSELTQDIHDGGDDTGIFIVELLSDTLEGHAKCLREFQENTQHGQHGLFPDVRTRGVGESDDIIQEIVGEGRSDDAGEARESCTNVILDTFSNVRGASRE